MVSYKLSFELHLMINSLQINRESISGGQASGRLQREGAREVRWQRSRAGQCQDGDEPV